MKWSREQMLERFLARDGDWNGRFLAGVKTTGIYCLPSCTARKPKPENTLFFPDEAGALSAGLRACKRCRPDHYYRKFDPDLEAVEVLVAAVRLDPASFADVGEMARVSGLGKTKLSASFRDHFHESPAGFLARQRVEAVAARMVSDGGKPTELAYEMGFESASAFHDNFTKHHALRPGAYRKLMESDSFRLSLPADFNRVRTLKLLGRDGASPTEALVGHRFAKALDLDGREALLTIEPATANARCEVKSAQPISPSGMSRAHRIAMRMLGLGCDPTALEKLVRRTRGLSRLVRGREGLRVLLTADVFEALLWSIIGQQVNLAFAMALRRRLVELTAGIGQASKTRARRNVAHLEGLTPHPGPQAVAKLDYSDLQALQYSRRKAEYVIDTSRSIVSGQLDLEQLSLASATRVQRTLLALRGIGPWSANYVMMRGIGFADSLPVGDSGLTASLKSFFELEERPNSEETRMLMKPFRPHRSLACLHLWQRLKETP